VESGRHWCRDQRTTITPTNSEPRPATSETKKVWSQAVSRILFSRNERGSFVCRTRYRGGQATYPEAQTGTGGPSLPYLVLLRRGFAMPHPLTRCAVRSYRTVSPLPPRGLRRAIGGFFSFSFSVASLRLVVC